MRRLTPTQTILIAAGLLVLVGVLAWIDLANSDPLRVRCTAPTQNNAGTCLAPILSTAAGTDSMWVVLTVVPVPPTIAPSRRDSVWRRPGGIIDITYNLLRGVYMVTATPGRKRVDGTMLYGCPAQRIGATTVTMPHTPNFLED